MREAVKYRQFHLAEKISAQEVWLCPLCPQKRTFCDALAMSAKCQKQTFRSEVPLTHFKSLTGIQPFADRLCCWPGAPFPTSPTAALSQASVAERPKALPPELGSGSMRHAAISYP